LLFSSLCEIRPKKFGSGNINIIFNTNTSDLEAYYKVICLEHEKRIYVEFNICYDMHISHYYSLLLTDVWFLEGIQLWYVNNTVCSNASIGGMCCQMFLFVSENLDVYHNRIKNDDCCDSEYIPPPPAKKKVLNDDEAYSCNDCIIEDYCDDDWIYKCKNQNYFIDNPIDNDHQYHHHHHHQHNQNYDKDRYHKSNHFYGSYKLKFNAITKTGFVIKNNLLVSFNLDRFCHHHHRSYPAIEANFTTEYYLDSCLTIPTDNPLTGEYVYMYIIPNDGTGSCSKTHIYSYSSTICFHKHGGINFNSCQDPDVVEVTLADNFDKTHIILDEFFDAQVIASDIDRDQDCTNRIIISFNTKYLHGKVIIKNKIILRENHSPHTNVLSSLASRNVAKVKKLHQLQTSFIKCSNHSHFDEQSFTCIYTNETNIFYLFDESGHPIYFVIFLLMIITLLILIFFGFFKHRIVIDKKIKK
jgi:hypothetical protein